MKSGSLRAMPAPPKRDHGLRHVELDHDAPAEAAAAARRAPAQRRPSPAARRRRGRAACRRRRRRCRRRRAILSVSRANTLLHIGPQVVGGDRRHRFQRAVGRTAIGMAGKRGRPPAPAGDSFGLVVSRRSPASICVADALDRARRRSAARSARAAAGRTPRPDRSFSVRSEPRKWSRSAEKLSSIALSSSRSLEGLGVELAGALVEQRRRPCWRRPACRPDPGVAPPVKAKVERDQRHRRLAHQPGLDAAGR